MNTAATKAEKIIASTDASARAYAEKSKMSHETLTDVLMRKSAYECGMLAQHIRQLVGDYEFQLNAPQTSHAVTSYKSGKTEYEIHFDVIENYGPEVVFHGVYVNASDVQEDLSESVLDAMQDHCYKVADEMLEESKVGAL